MSIQKKLSAFIRRQQALLICASSPFATAYPPGHFHSPLPDSKEIELRESELFDDRIRTCPGIDLNDEAQLKLFREFVTYYEDVPFAEEATSGRRYHFQNAFFSYGDSIILYSFLRHFKPKRVVEVGSGFSSAVMLDTSSEFLDQQPAFTFIDPNPERLHGLLSPEDERTCEILDVPVQRVGLERFGELGEGDVLFIDSSHVVRIGSDVSYLVFEVLPSLARGVIVGIHDILWPFEYPREWLRRGYAWNEAYLLRSFLQYNDTFEVLYYNDYFAKKFGDEVHQHMPLIERDPGGTLWLRKKR